jgi:hypothetical protein
LAGAFFAVLAFLAAGFFAAVVLAFPLVLAFFAVDVYFLVVGVAAAGFVVGALREVLAFNGFFAVIVFLVVVALALVAAGFLGAGLVF